MFSLTDALKYYLYPRYIDMGKGVESLGELLRSEPGCNPLSGDAFLFFGRKRDAVKILRWDKDGFFLYYKRLEAGTFELPRFEPHKGLCELSYETFFLLLRGLPLRQISRRKRFRI
jgi:transposase